MLKRILQSNKKSVVFNNDINNNNNNNNGINDDCSNATIVDHEAENIFHDENQYLHLIQDINL